MHATTNDSQVDFRTFRTTKTLHNIFRTHFHSGNGAVIDRNDTVTGKDADFLGRSVADRLHHQQGVFYHLELHSDTLEVTLKWFVHLLHFLCIRISRVRIKLCQHFDDGFFYQLVFIYFVHIEIGDCKLCHL